MSLAAFAVWLWMLAPLVLRSVVPWLLPVLSYALIGYGASLLHPAAGYLSVGGLLWLDLYTEQMRSR